MLHAPVAVPVRSVRFLHPHHSLRRCSTQQPPRASTCFVYSPTAGGDLDVSAQSAQTSHPARSTISAPDTSGQGPSGS